MNLLRLFLTNARTPKSKFAVFVILAGVSNVLLLAILNNAAQHAANQDLELMLVVSFVLCIGIFVLAQKYIWRVASDEISSLVHEMRVRIINKIATFDLEHLEKIGKAELYAAINQHAYTIMVSALPIILSLQSIILIFFTLVYLAYLSLAAFLVALIAIVTALIYSVKRSKDMNQYLDKAIAAEQNVYYSLSDLIEGFKEIKLNQVRESDLLQDADDLSITARDNRIVANVEMSINFIATNAAFYFLLAALVFVVPQLSGQTNPELIVKITTAGLFLIGPITTMVSIMPTYAYAEMAVDLITRTEERLDGHHEQLGSREEQDFLPVGQLHLDQVSYRYQHADSNESFSIGPITLHLPSHQIIFLTGGNGSGKSTLIKVLLGLYQPGSGKLSVNGISVNSGNLRSYRNLFSTVLSDYHLFNKTYGLRNIDENRVNQLLKKMGLANKTRLVDGHFDTLELSTGQRKRLALIAAILEDRPIMVFDEWAADQDPGFRKTFYHEILPELKADGKTIIAVTHDEKYFDCSDQHFHMEDGLISELHLETHSHA
jgi:putative ATP-binding cassette transporter